MACRIAVGGKGGVGKTTLAGLIVRYLLRRGHTPILAVDADPNANLGDVLGLSYETTVGSIIAHFIDDKTDIPEGMTKERYLHYKLNAAITEGRGIDLLVMGRGEGQGCYCYPNLVLRGFVDSLSENYPYVVIDNEAGMEHLSRRTSEKIDYMFVVSDPSIRGIRAATRIRELIAELKLDIAHVCLVLMRAQEHLAEPLVEHIYKSEMRCIGTIPEDTLIQEYELTARPLLGLPDESPAVVAVHALLEHIVGSQPCHRNPPDESQIVPRQ